MQDDSISGKEYQEGDNYTFTMPDYDLTIVAGYYNPAMLMVEVDGEIGTIGQFSDILFLFDNSMSKRITNETVCEGNNISLNLQEGYSFNAEDTTKTHVVAKLNGTELDAREESHYREFIMQSESATLVITTTPPQSWLNEANSIVELTYI